MARVERNWVACQRCGNTGYRPPLPFSPEALPGDWSTVLFDNDGRRTVLEICGLCTTAFVGFLANGISPPAGGEG